MSPVNYKDDTTSININFSVPQGSINGPMPVHYNNILDKIVNYMQLAMQMIIACTQVSELVINQLKMQHLVAYQTA